MKVEISITGDFQTGEVQVTGVIDDLRVVYWLLGEARRLIEKRATQREAKKSNIVVVKPGGMPT